MLIIHQKLAFIARLVINTRHDNVVIVDSCGYDSVVINVGCGY